MRLPNKADFLTALWVILLLTLLFLGVRAEAHAKPDYETAVECINGYKFAVVFNSKKDAKYVTIIDMEQIIDANGEGIMCGSGHEDHVWPSSVPSTTNVR